MKPTELPYNPQVINQFLPLFELGETYTFIRYVKNWVFVVQQGEYPRILRITPNWRRTKPEIAGELDFILHLARGGMNVAPPLLSKEGNYIETIEFEGMTYHAVLFEHATGHRVQLETDWGPALYTAWAQQLALMHKLSKEYVAVNKGITRHAWNDQDHFKWARELVPATDTSFWRSYDELFEWLSCLPKTPDSYGLIHNDLIHSNLFFSGSKLTIIDFDDYCFGWFAYDIGISLFHIQVGCTRKGLPLDFPSLKKYFLKTYQETFPIDPMIIESIDRFVQLRRISTYMWCHMNGQSDFLPVRRFCSWIIEHFIHADASPPG